MPRRTVITASVAGLLLAGGAAAALPPTLGSGTVTPPPSIVFLAEGVRGADALSSGGVASQLGAPILTTTTDGLQPSAAAALATLSPDVVVVLGGEAALSSQVVSDVATATGLAATADNTATASGIVRVFGSDRFATAAAISQLLADYDPAYLPVDATAVGALVAESLTPRQVEVEHQAASMAYTTTNANVQPSTLGLEWAPTFSGSGRVLMSSPDDWDGGDVEIDVRFVVDSATEGVVDFFSRARSYDVGDTRVDGATLDAPGVAISDSASGFGRAWVQTFTVPADRLDDGELWELPFQRGGADETFLEPVDVQGIVVRYGSTG